MRCYCLFCGLSDRDVAIFRPPRGGPLGVCPDCARAASRALEPCEIVPFRRPSARSPFRKFRRPEHEFLHGNDGPEAA